MKKKKFNYKKLCYAALPLTALVSYFGLSLSAVDRGAAIAPRNYTDGEFELTTLWYSAYEDDPHYVLNTPGCRIPSARLRYNATGPRERRPCGRAFAAVARVNATHARVRSELTDCALQFVTRSKTPGRENTEIAYSRPIKFTKEKYFAIEEDFFRVKCRDRKKPVEDVFALVKRSRTSPEPRGTWWNVLVVGMDTMSRARTLSVMNNTVKYFRENRWLEFQGYHKIADNTAPNLIALLSGETKEEFQSHCGSTLDRCNRRLMWARYRAAGYGTAYGEDHLQLPDTFSAQGFTLPPTTHYMRPLFLTGETARKLPHPTVCNGRAPSADRILDYAVDFATVYRDKPFFGFFWINSDSHNPANLPERLDDGLVETFRRLNRSGVLNDTFVIFLSDHGLRFGPNRLPFVESYYDERLPTLFISTPLQFQRKYKTEYRNLQSNQMRLVTPYDLSLTLSDILRLSTGSDEVPRSKTCPDCHSLFVPISPHRKCPDAAIDEKWCSCHDIFRLNENNTIGLQSVQTALSYIKALSSNTRTAACTKCAEFSVSSILRMHSYYNDNKTVTHTVVAFKVSPGQFGYEAVVAFNGREYRVVGSVSIISPYFGKTGCVVGKASYFCYCVEIYDCGK